jgi:hypothetical protein
MEDSVRERTEPAEQRRLLPVLAQFRHRSFDQVCWVLEIFGNQRMTDRIVHRTILFIPLTRSPVECGQQLGLFGRQPLDVETFIHNEKQALADALAMLNAGMPHNPKVKLSERNGKGWITLSPLSALSEPANLLHLKAEVKGRWGWTSLLDMLKETDLRVGFTDLFKSATVHEILPRPVLQKRLLYCLYAFGTNTGLSRVATGDEEVGYRDLLYVRRRFINKDSLRAAIQQVANEILRIRHPEWWGSDTTACASDGKKFGAWDQNLLTEWHIRYRGPGIMVYWHVEKKALCIYSQVKRCSSSEVAAMIEGVLRHCFTATSIRMENSSSI